MGTGLLLRKTLGRPYSPLHAAVVGHSGPIWMRIDSPSSPRISWQCFIEVTNGGNRRDAAVRVELRWRKLVATVTTWALPPRRETLRPSTSGRLKLDAWTPLGPGEDPAGDLEAELSLFDLYGGVHRTKVIFRQSSLHPVHAP
jgi:hypothetical protein